MRINSHPWHRMCLQTITKLDSSASMSRRTMCSSTACTSVACSICSNDWTAIGATSRVLPKVAALIPQLRDQRRQVAKDVGRVFGSHTFLPKPRRRCW